MDQFVQRGSQGAVKLRLLRTNDRSGPFGQRRAADRPEDRMGRKEVESNQPAGSKPLPPHGISKRLAPVIVFRSSPAEVAGRAVWVERVIYFVGCSRTMVAPAPPKWALASE